MILMTRSHDKILRWSNISDDQDDATNKFDMTARDYYPPLNSKHSVWKSPKISHWVLFNAVQWDFWGDFQSLCKVWLSLFLLLYNASSKMGMYVGDELWATDHFSFVCKNEMYMQING